LYRLHHGEVYRFLARRTEPDIAADLAHDTFTVAWRRLDTIPDDPRAARAWLLHTARNHLLNNNRAIARDAGLMVQLADIGEQQISDPEGSAVATSSLATAWKTLSPASQEILALLHLDGLDTAQAAKVLSVSAVTVRNRARKAEQELRRALDRDGAEAINRGISERMTQPNSVKSVVKSFDSFREMVQGGAL